MVPNPQRAPVGSDRKRRRKSPTLELGFCELEPGLPRPAVGLGMAAHGMLDRASRFLKISRAALATEAVAKFLGPFDQELAEFERCAATPGACPSENKSAAPRRGQKGRRES